MRILIEDMLILIVCLLTAVMLGVGSYKLGLSASRAGDSCLVELQGKHMDTLYSGKYGRTDQDRQACIVKLKPRVMAYPLPKASRNELECRYGSDSEWKEKHCKDEEEEA